MRGQKFEGEVQSIYPDKGEFLVRIQTSNLPKQILPGMTADVAIEISKKDKAVLVPINAVSSGHLILLENKKIKKIKVEVGLVDGIMAEIVSPALSSKDSVVIEK